MLNEVELAATPNTRRKRKTTRHEFRTKTTTKIKGIVVIKTGTKNNILPKSRV